MLILNGLVFLLWQNIQFTIPHRHFEIVSCQTISAKCFDIIGRSTNVEVFKVEPEPANV